MTSFNCFSIQIVFYPVRIFSSVMGTILSDDKSFSTYGHYHMRCKFYELFVNACTKGKGKNLS